MLTTGGPELLKSYDAISSRVATVTAGKFFKQP